MRMLSMRPRSGAGAPLRGNSSYVAAQTAPYILVRAWMTPRRHRCVSYLWPQSRGIEAEQTELAPGGVFERKHWPKRQTVFFFRACTDNPAQGAPEVVPGRGSASKARAGSLPGKTRGKRGENASSNGPGWRKKNTKRRQSDRSHLGTELRAERRAFAADPCTTQRHRRD